MPGSWEPFGSTRGMDPPPGDPSPEAPATAPAALPPQRPEPRQRMAIVTCMDARIDPLAVLGLSLGDANVIRNAGATVSDDVLRSLGAAVELLGVVRAIVMGHTNCAGHGSDAAAAAARGDGAPRLRSPKPDSIALDPLIYHVANGARDPL